MSLKQTSESESSVFHVIFCTAPQAGDDPCSITIATEKEEIVGTVINPRE